MNTPEEKLIWPYILVVAAHLEYLAIAVLLVADQEDASKFWAYEERTTLGMAADKLSQRGVFPPETIERLKAIARLRNSVVHRHVLRGITGYAVYDERNVFDDRGGLETLVNDADQVIAALNTWLDQHDRNR
jgi:hypothetical protein